MKLFDLPSNEKKNWLPFDGTVNYYSDFIAQQSADRFFKELQTNINWERDRLVLFGKEIVTRRQVAWYGDEPFEYTYSRVKKVAKPWTQELLALKKSVEEGTGGVFNACLMNFYHDGDDGMGWHSDNEKELQKNAPIASLSVGAPRRFMFQHRHCHEKVELLLESGSLLLMKDETQTHWLHQLPKSKKVHQPRINVTFRRMVSQQQVKY